MYPVIPESDRPSDLADDCILSPDGVNPVSKNDEVPSEKDLFDDKIAVYPVPGATLPFYFPGYPNQPLSDVLTAPAQRLQHCGHQLIGCRKFSAFFRDRPGGGYRL